MAPTDRHKDWQSTYAKKGEREVSWFQESAPPSLALIEEFSTQSSAVIDIGGGNSRLPDALLGRGFLDVTVLDLSSTALMAAQARIGGAAEQVHWIVADVTEWEPPRSYDVWHDRAAFHFLVAEYERIGYLSRLAKALKPGGHAIIATFAPDGSEKCSGLPVQRYDAEALGKTLGADFRLVSTQRRVHVTPWGSTQPFQFSVFRHMLRRMDSGHHAP